MALVLSERDYKLLTLWTKIVGIFTFAAGTIQIVDFHRPLLGLGLVVLGIAITLAPVPMTVVRPDTFPDGDGATGDDGRLTVNE
jgi:hypothetical protein